MMADRNFMWELYQQEHFLGVQQLAVVCVAFTVLEGSLQSVHS